MSDLDIEIQEIQEKILSAHLRAANKYGALQAALAQVLIDEQEEIAAIRATCKHWLFKMPERVCVTCGGRKVHFVCRN